MIEYWPICISIRPFPIKLAFFFGIMYIKKNFSTLFLLKELLALLSILHNFDLDFSTQKSLNAKF